MKIFEKAVNEAKPQSVFIRPNGNFFTAEFPTVAMAQDGLAMALVFDEYAARFNTSVHFSDQYGEARDAMQVEFNITFVEKEWQGVASW
jgi:hypothetical protein